MRTRHRLLWFDVRKIDRVGERRPPGVRKSLKQDEVARVRVQVLVLAVSSSPKVVVPWTDADQYNAPELDAEGGLAFGAGIDLAFLELERHKIELNLSGTPYTRPWLVLMASHHPSDHWESSAERVRSAIQDKSCVVFPFALSEEARDALSAIQIPGGPVFMLMQSQFLAAFGWLSASAVQVSSAAPGQGALLPTPSFEIRN